MIGWALRLISALILIATLGATLSGLYLMISDMSTLAISNATPSNLKLNMNGLFFDLKLNITYNGKHEIDNFILEVEINGKPFKSKPITIRSGINEIIIPCNLSIWELGRNITVRPGISISYMNIIPFSVKLPSVNITSIPIIIPKSIVSRYYNETYVEIVFTAISLVKIEVYGKVDLTANGTEIALCDFKPVDVNETITLTWRIPSYAEDDIDGVVIYVKVDDTYIKVYEWRFKVG